MKKIPAVTLTLLLATSFASYAGPVQYFKKLDTNQDQMLDKTEFTVFMDKFFAKNNITDDAVKTKKLNYAFNRRDLNADGKITLEEFTASKSKK